MLPNGVRLGFLRIGKQQVNSQHHDTFTCGLLQAQLAACQNQQELGRYGPPAGYASRLSGASSVPQHWPASMESHMGKTYHLLAR
jgi:hypothetical protein